MSDLVGGIDSRKLAVLIIILFILLVIVGAAFPIRRRRRRFGFCSGGLGCW
ncbi:YjcZ family sporulation protein [Pseudalkalibacillus sp. A8]|uniref:YjcZ family sporulation protein n=1 Tax=Pseudalkalibacillus sp. A8 TaxID=3382641 RepID=UPI0038B4E85E